MPDTDATIRVLVVDDHPVVSAGVRAMLSDASGLEVVGEAATGKQALNFCRSRTPDVVVLDLRMPDMLGADICREIKNQWPKMKVLFLSSYGDEANVLMGLSAGADGYLLKNITGMDIAAAVVDVARGGFVVEPKLTKTLIRRSRRTRGGNGTQLDVLTAGELAVLELVGKGQLNKEIGYELNLAEKSVRNRLTRIFAKLGVSTRTEAALIYERAQVRESVRKNSP